MTSVVLCACVCSLSSFMLDSSSCGGVGDGESGGEGVAGSISQVRWSVNADIFLIK